MPFFTPVKSRQTLSLILSWHSWTGRGHLEWWAWWVRVPERWPRSGSRHTALKIYKFYSTLAHQHGTSSHIECSQWKKSEDTKLSFLSYFFRWFFLYLLWISASCQRTTQRSARSSVATRLGIGSICRGLRISRIRTGGTSRATTQASLLLILRILYVVRYIQKLQWIGKQEVDIWMCPLLQGEVRF